MICFSPHFNANRRAAPELRSSHGSGTVPGMGNNTALRDKPGPEARLYIYRVNKTQRHATAGMRRNANPATSGRNRNTRHTQLCKPYRLTSMSLVRSLMSTQQQSEGRAAQGGALGDSGGARLANRQQALDRPRQCVPWRNTAGMPGGGFRIRERRVQGRGQCGGTRSATTEP